MVYLIQFNIKLITFMKKVHYCLITRMTYIDLTLKKKLFTPISPPLGVVSHMCLEASQNRPAAIGFGHQLSDIASRPTLTATKSASHPTNSGADQSTMARSGQWQATR